MPNERAILCGGVRSGALPFNDPDPVLLRRFGRNANVHLLIQDVRHAMLKPIPKLFEDLIDIAAYIYSADQAVKRGGDGVLVFGDDWRRKLFFRIPVRVPELWRSAVVQQQLVSTLSFLSDDEYHFEFEPLLNDPTLVPTFEFDSTPYDGIVEDVVLFSGGIDSIGGVVKEAVTDKRKVLIVNHRSTEKLTRRHRHLLSLLNDHAKDHRPLHIPVRINKIKRLGREPTQRSRSFLYATLGATFANMLGLNRIRFYENGIVSLNLPPSAQVVGARATRTTHPQVLNGFASLFSSLAERPFAVENQFLWRTKTEVVKLIADAGCADVLKFSTSCTHTWEMTKQFTHCGICSQCIDRRFAVLAAGQEGNDPAEAYKCDLLIGAREGSISRTMIAAYLETANEIEKMDALQFFGRFGEASRVLRHIAGHPDATAMQVFDLHRRHAKQVNGVVDQAIAKYGPAIRRRELPASCTVRLVSDAGLVIGSNGSSHDHNGKTLAFTSGNYIVRKGRCWAIRFGGQDEQIYTPDVGFSYLQILLDHPNIEFTASELCSVVVRQTRDLHLRVVSVADVGQSHTSMSQGLHADEILDAEGRESLRIRLNEIDEALEMTDDNGSATRLETREELEREKQFIADELSAAQGLHGRTRELGSERDRVRKRVSNAIRRALKQVDDYDKRLTAHLVRPILNLGHTMSYVPRDGMSWATFLDKNA